MSIDLFKNYSLQREELLARIAQELQLDESRKARMESAYNSISTVLNNDQGFFKEIDVDVYAQGSVATGTTTKPLVGSEFDLDIVVHIKQLYTNHTPSEVYNALLNILENDGRYKEKIEKKKRCVRLKYANDFHMDIMPGCIKFIIGGNELKVPDRELKNWTDSNPKGFADWFLNRAKTIKEKSILQKYRNQIVVELRAEVQDLPEDEFYSKTPLQRSVQLIKRYRDIYFENNDTYATSSIVLTTLMGQFYDGENSIYTTLENVITKVKQGYQLAVNTNQKFKVLNPVNSAEDFTDKWTEKHYQHFFLFIEDFYVKWNAIKEGFEKGAIEYIHLFGEGIYKETLKKQIAQMSKYSTESISIANGLIISNKALTDTKGQINSNVGYKNEPHRNYGE